MFWWGVVAGTGVWFFLLLASAVAGILALRSGRLMYWLGRYTANFLMTQAQNTAIRARSGPTRAAGGGATGAPEPPAKN